MVLLSTSEFRTHEPTALEESALQRLLDANEAAVEAILGPVGEVTELHVGDGTYLFLRRPAASITAVSERNQTIVTDLEADDYELRSDGISLRRLDYGTNPSLGWVGSVSIEYVPTDDVAERQRVVIALTRLDLHHQPGLASQQIGDWSEAYSGSSVWNYQAEREAILATLRATGAGFA